MKITIITITACIIALGFAINYWSDKGSQRDFCDKHYESLDVFAKDWCLKSFNLFPK